jgi:capsular exopolysaccharide synthesis family protein
MNHKTTTLGKESDSKILAKTQKGILSIDSLLNWKAFRPLKAQEHKCFENLSINLAYQSKEKKHQVILMTASNAGEGTSTIAIHSAVTLANNFQYKVLLIDLNYRFSNCGNQDQFNHSGADDFFESNTASVINAIEVENLNILTFNRGALDPIKNLDDERFDEFLKRQRKTYDYVILDAPPIKQSPISRILSSKVDGVIMIIEAHKTRKHVARRARDTLLKAGANIIGAVINKRKFFIPEFIYKFF